MTVYAYRCRECGATRDSLQREDVQPCPCGGLSRRDWSRVQFGAQPFKPHWNYATGTYVNNRNEFEDHLKRKAANNSDQTGMEHSYAPLDPGEIASLEPKTDTAILEDQNRAIHDKGIHPVEATPA